MTICVMERATYQIQPGEEFIVEGTLEHFARYADHGGKLEVVVDVGSHIGELAIDAARRGAGIVWAIEPDPNNYQMLCENIMQNECGHKIIPLMLAIGQDNQTAIIRIITNQTSNSGMRSLLYRDAVAAQGYSVNCISLETLLKWTGPVDYLKLDIEGMEHFAISSTPVEVLKTIENLDLDVHDIGDPRFFNMEGYNPRIIREHLALAGFDVPETQNGHAGILRRRK